ncbi:MAG: D-alanyl-D-alanine carboxypeptidase/D-alanyl-D-alanine-endopeptidase [Bacteroidota bacterium]
MKLLVNFLPILVLLLLNTPPAPAQSASLQRFQVKLNALQNDSMARHGLVAFSIRSVKTGATIVAINSDKSTAPASTLKLVTTATALAVLGENFTFETSLEYDGVLKEGVLQGNLYIRGHGDPTLGCDRFDNYPALPELMKFLATKVKAAGIKQINGAVVADASLFEENALPSTWIWGDIGNYYGAAAYGLNLNENLYRVVFQPGKTVGSPAKILRTEPAVPGLEFTNLVATGSAASGDQCYIYGAPYQPVQYLEGTIPAGVASFPVRGSLPDPPFLCAFSLHQQLKTHAIGIRDAPTTDRLLRQQKHWPAGKRTVIYTHQSPPLKAIVERTNFHSINLYAEALLKTIARYLAPVQNGAIGTTANGTQAVQDYWKKKGLDMNGFWMKDGSGLSPKNTITAGQMTEVLRLTASSAAFYASIPVVGVSGTVKSLAKGTKAVNNVRAKSGSMERVKSYAGYFTNQAGELMSYAFFINNYDSQGNRIARQMEDILAAMVEL